MDHISMMGGSVHDHIEILLLHTEPLIGISDSCFLKLRRAIQNEGQTGLWNTQLSCQIIDIESR